MTETTGHHDDAAIRAIALAIHDLIARGGIARPAEPPAEIPVDPTNVVGHSKMWFGQTVTVVAQIPGWVFVRSSDVGRPFPISYDNWWNCVTYDLNETTDPIHLLNRQPGDSILWKGQVPTGWQVCDGTNGSPDLGNNWVGLNYLLEPGEVIVDYRDSAPSALVQNLPDVNYIEKLHPDGTRFRHAWERG